MVHMILYPNNSLRTGQQHYFLFNLYISLIINNIIYGVIFQTLFYHANSYQYLYNVKSWSTCGVNINAWMKMLQIHPRIQFYSIIMVSPKWWRTWSICEITYDQWKKLYFYWNKANMRSQDNLQNKFLFYNNFLLDLSGCTIHDKQNKHFSILTWLNIGKNNILHKAIYTYLMYDNTNAKVTSGKMPDLFHRQVCTVLYQYIHVVTTCTCISREKSQDKLNVWKTLLGCFPFFAVSSMYQFRHFLFVLLLLLFPHPQHQHLEKKLQQTGHIAVC